ncbi:MAG: PA0069 family radical SAM protein [candidate division KSB1 bacterium]|nr:PA0069 family radical SAM protein [candidate division KSB1 bacterium]MDZ7367467.1 PA0069 family radical SAM protein [candidate division KSB1 bacterium]MDZ7405428.1 PA0069 family radical SAM protein [candidate division KSB1 bacterium]
MSALINPNLPLKGRGTLLNPVNRFEPIEIEPDPDWLDQAEEPPIKTQYFVDATRTILSKNDSPDIPFTHGLNPYRGCEHGCIYCYARPTHEYFGLSSGLDFETKIMVKLDAPALLEKTFRDPKWQPQVIAFSGNTDCYQVVERKLQITRRCLEVFLKYRNPLGMITKNALIVRDIDLLRQLAGLNLVTVTISITTLDNHLCRKMEPRTSAPEKRLEAVAQLAAAGIPTGVNVAPIIPGLNDHEMPAILAEAAKRGAISAGHVMLRLPYAVKDLFVNWLRQYFPDRANKVLHAIQEMRGGRLNDPCFGSRFVGEGGRVEAVAQMFDVTCKKLGLNQKRVRLTTEHFRRSEQADLFG